MNSYASPKQKGVTVSSNPLKSGGEGEIRTPGTLLTYTRFPIVLLRPARTPLHSVIVHRSKPNICIAASKELQAKKSNMGRLLQIFWSAGYHRMAKACGQEGLGKVAWMFAALVAPSCHAVFGVLYLQYCPAVPLWPCAESWGKQGPPSVCRAGLVVQSGQCANAASRPCALCLSFRLRGGAFW